MKPKQLKVPMAEMGMDTLQAKKVRIETPMGAIESDSGNHLVDIGTILLIMVAFFAMKRFFKTT